MIYHVTSLRSSPNDCTLPLLHHCLCLCNVPSSDDEVKDEFFTHFVQVAVAPHFAVHKSAGQDASLGVELRPLTHAAPLQADQLSSGGVGHVDHRQAAARQPHGRPALGVVHDAQRELAVVVVDLLRARVAVKVDGEEVTPMGLERGVRGRAERERDRGPISRKSDILNGRA